MIQKDNLTEFCLDCQKCRLAQKDGIISEETGKPAYKKGDFIVRCKGIPANNKFIPQYDKVVKSLEPDEIELAQGLYDPITWAAQHLKWYPRKSHNLDHSYQDMILRCSSPRKVLRLGRRLGKCLALDSLVLTKEQGLIPIKVIKPSESIATLDDDDGKIKWTKDWYLQDNGVQEVFKVQTRLGNIDHVTGNHPYLKFTETGLEWTEVKDLRPGDRIAIPKSYEGLYRKESQDKNLFKLLGYLISDGGTNYTDQARFTNFCPETISDFTEVISHYGCELSEHQKSNYGIKRQKGIKENLVVKLIKEHKIQCKAIHKKVPASVYSASDEDVSYFLGAAWDSDGWVCDNEIGYCSASYDLANGIKHLLKRFGINAVLSYKKVKYKNEHRDAWNVGIYNIEDSFKFYQNIKLLAKKDKLRKIIYFRSQKAKGNNWLHTFPSEMHSIIDSKLDQRKIKWKDIARNKNCRQRKQYGPTYDKVREINEKLNSEEISGLLEANILFDEIKSIDTEGLQPTLDFSVNGTQNFIANDTITHNTEVLVISILHFLFTNSPKVQRWDESQKMYVDGFSTILVLTPYLSQVKLIFARIRELIERNPALRKEIKKDVSTPYHHLELYNGAKVVGFSSGAKSGSGAETARGQKADFIVLDEMDYLNENDIETILALLMEHADVSLLCSSTPSGKREYFYGFCQERMDFKEFYYPAHVNPAWSPQMESELREFYRTEAAWQHEILAEFGEASTGVFQHKYVEEARKNYRYTEIIPQNTWTYSIGVDWNDTANGTKLVVTGWNPRKQIFRVVDKVTIQKVGWTQTTAIDALINLNRIWKPDFLYVDEGYGATQIEVIKQFGLEAKFREDEHSKIDMCLQNIVGINSSSKIEVYDPITKMPIKKTTKPFMVENAVRRFEKQQIEFSEYDEDLYRQLIGYQITKVNVSGTPIYEAGPDGDHDLDAFILSLLAFQMELSELTNVNYSTNLVFSGRIGEGSKQSSNIPSGSKPEDRKLGPQAPEIRSDYGVTLFSGPTASNNLIASNRVYSAEAFNNDDRRRKNTGRQYLKPSRSGLTRRRNI